MNDSIVIFLTITLTTAIAYSIYKFMLGVEDHVSEKDLQITSEDIVAQLTILLKQKKYKIVENLAKSYLKSKKNNFEVRRILAKNYLEMGSFEEALEEGKKLVKMNPKDTDIKIFLANCYKKLKEPQDAIKTYLEVLEDDFDNAWVMKNLAVLYLETNQKISAIKMYEKMVDFIDNQNEKIEIQIIIAELYTTMNDFNSAIAQYYRILDVYPDDVATKKALVEIYEMQENYDEMISMAQSIETTTIDEKEVLWSLKKILTAYKALENYEAALDISYKIKENSLSDKIRIGDEIAQILVKLGKVDEGISLFEELIETLPDDKELNKNLAKAYVDKGQFETAVSIYKKLIEDANYYEVESLNKDLSTVYAEWGIHLFRQKDNDGCFKKFNTAIQCYSKNPDIFYRLGCVDVEIKNFKEGLANFKKAIELDDTVVKYYYAAADCYDAMDSLYDEKKYLSDSLKLDDKNSEVYYKLALIFQKQNDLNSAIINMEKAVSLNDDFVDAKFKLALLYEHMGKKEDAIILYEQILKVDPTNDAVINNLAMLEG